jgi:hypothetical protein
MLAAKPIGRQATHPNLYLQCAHINSTKIRGRRKLGEINTMQVDSEQPKASQPDAHAARTGNHTPGLVLHDPICRRNSQGECAQGTGVERSPSSWMLSTYGERRLAEQQLARCAAVSDTRRQGGLAIRPAMRAANTKCGLRTSHTHGTEPTPQESKHPLRTHRANNAPVSTPRPRPPRPPPR